MGFFYFYESNPRGSVVKKKQCCTLFFRQSGEGGYCWQSQRSPNHKYAQQTVASFRPCQTKGNHPLRYGSLLFFYIFAMLSSSSIILMPWGHTCSQQPHFTQAAADGLSLGNSSFAAEAVTFEERYLLRIEKSSEIGMLFLHTSAQ